MCDGAVHPEHPGSLRICDSESLQYKRVTVRPKGWSYVGEPDNTFHVSGG